MAAPRSTLFISVLFLLILPDIADVVLAVDGNWSVWREWSECSATCGNGRRKRIRVCNNPAPSEDGEECEGRSRQVQRCRERACAVDGGWSGWSMWTQCSATCGQGTRTQIRECKSPAPANGGKDCVGSQAQRIKCFSDVDCPVNGQWSDWSEWSSCSVTCGAGVKQRWRKCDNRQNGGLDCNRTEAGEMQELSCNANVAFCAVNGGWSHWGPFGDCISHRCGSKGDVSYIIRQRSCSNPYPAHKGTMCQGTFLDSALCEVPVNCPVDGQWGKWSEWKCQINSVTRKRQCNTPAPSNGGKPCSGSNVETYLKDDEEDDQKYEELCADFQPEVDDEEDENVEASGINPDNEEYENNYEDEEEEEEEEEDIED